MRIAVVGAGGTGGFFGALLARAGQEVTFVARGAHLEAIRTRGIAVRSARVGDFAIDARATDAPETLDPVDLVLFCVKTYDTDAAAARLPALVGPDTAVLSVQNGLDSPDRLARVVGPGPVLGGLARVSAVIEGPGVIGHRAGPDVIVLGELGGGTSPRVERIAATLREAGITAEVHPDIRVALWDKFLFICGASGLTALTRLPLGPILGTPASRELLQGVLAEVEAVARATGVALPAGATARALGMMAALPPSMRGSLAVDLAAGRRLEIESLNGEVVRRGRALGVPTPLNLAVYAALAPYAAGPPSAA